MSSPTRGRSAGARAMPPEPPPPPPRFSQATLFRAALAVLVVLGIGTFTAALLIRPEVDALGTGPGAARAQRELVRILEDLRSTWDPEAKQRLLDAAGDYDPRYLGVLRGILGQSNHPLRLQAIEYAGAMGASELRPDVAELALRGRADLRAAAVLAAEKLGAWGNDVVVELLATDIGSVQVAALQVVAQRGDGPWPEVMALLSSGDPAVRGAVLEAVPQRPSAKALQALWKAIEAGPAEASALGLAALARTEVAGEMESQVADLLGRAATPEVQLAALQCLAAKGAPLASAEVVRELALGHGDDVRVRAQALHCLERTESYDADEIRESIPLLEPRLQYFAARCLVAAGDPKGLLVLVDLVEGQEADVAVASRRLLARLCGSSPGATAVEFRGRIEAGVECAGPLPEPVGF